jgi:hypothetical protein
MQRQRGRRIDTDNFKRRPCVPISSSWVEKTLCMLNRAINRLEWTRSIDAEDLPYCLRPVIYFSCLFFRVIFSNTSDGMRIPSEIMLPTNMKFANVLLSDPAGTYFSDLFLCRLRS